jgi:hypothetical protein
MVIPISEADKVDLWKMDRFLELGFDGDEVVALLYWNADWREAKGLIDGGCPPELALEILKPLDLPLSKQKLVSEIVDEAIQANASIRI